MKQCRYIIETKDQNNNWIAFAKTDREGNAGLIADALAQRIGAARYTKTGHAGSVAFYKQES